MMKKKATRLFINDEDVSYLLDDKGELKAGDTKIEYGEFYQPKVRVITDNETFTFDNEKELADILRKSRPLKPCDLDSLDWSGWVCPTCGSREIDDNLPDFYCVDCGQSLDWDN